LCGVAPDPCFLNQNLHLKNLHVNKLERVVCGGGGERGACVVPAAAGPGEESWRGGGGGKVTVPFPLTSSRPAARAVFLSARPRARGARILPTHAMHALGAVLVAALLVVRATGQVTLVGREREKSVMLAVPSMQATCTPLRRAPHPRHR